MRTKIAAIMIVALFFVVPFILVTDDSDAESTNKTILPYDRWNTKAWVSTQKEYYNGESGVLCFNTDPYDDIVKVANGQMDSSDLNYVESPTYGTKYWIAGFSYYSPSYSVRDVAVEPQIFYLDSGKYTIKILHAVGSDIYLRNANDLVDSKGGDSERIPLTDGKGDIEVDLRNPTAFYFSASGETMWILNPITYTVDPEPAIKTVSDYSQKATVVANKQWVAYTTVASLDGKVQFYDSSTYCFAKGSSGDTAFLENVVKKNKIDASAYKPASSTFDVYGQQIVMYKLVNVDEGGQSYTWINISSDHSDSNYTSERYEVTTERFETGQDVNSKLYAGKNFSLAVKYDTSKVVFIAIAFPTLYGNTDYVPLESGREYSFEMDCASEYQLFAMVRDSSDSLDAVEVEIYTEGIATPDDGGMIFAVVTIILCALAFGTLFMAGRRPKWKEDAGLPDFDAPTPESPSEDVPGDIPAEIDEDK